MNARYILQGTGFSQEVTIGREEEESIRQEIRAKHLPEIRQQVQLKLEGEVRTADKCAFVRSFDAWGANYT